MSRLRTSTWNPRSSRFAPRARALSHDFQGGLRGGQLLLAGRELLFQSGDFRLLLGQLAAFLGAAAGGAGGVVPVEDARVAQPAPLDDLGGMQGVGAQITAALAALDCVFVALQVGELLGRGDGAAAWLVRAGLGGIHGPILRHGAGRWVDGGDAHGGDQSCSRPVWGGYLAMNRWSHSTLTDRAMMISGAVGWPGECLMSLSGVLRNRDTQGSS